MFAPMSRGASPISNKIQRIEEYLYYLIITVIQPYELLIITLTSKYALF